jgi:hypothetical protein
MPRTIPRVRAVHGGPVAPFYQAGTPASPFTHYIHPQNNPGMPETRYRGQFRAQQVSHQVYRAQPRTTNIDHAAQLAEQRVRGYVRERDRLQFQAMAAMPTDDTGSYRDWRQTRGPANAPPAPVPRPMPWANPVNNYYVPRWAPPPPDAMVMFDQMANIARMQAARSAQAIVKKMLHR